MSSDIADHYEGFPPGVEADMLNLPQASADENALYLSLGGSSSCSPVPTSVDVQKGEFTITIGRGWTISCTADLVVTTFEIPIDSAPDVVTVIDGEERHSLEVALLRSAH